MANPVQASFFTGFGTSQYNPVGYLSNGADTLTGFGGFVQSRALMLAATITGIATAVLHAVEVPVKLVIVALKWIVVKPADWAFSSQQAAKMSDFSTVGEHFGKFARTTLSLIPLALSVLTTPALGTGALRLLNLLPAAEVPPAPAADANAPAADANAPAPANAPQSIGTQAAAAALTAISNGVATPA